MSEKTKYPFGLYKEDIEFCEGLGIHVTEDIQDLTSQLRDTVLGPRLGDDWDHAHCGGEFQNVMELLHYPEIEHFGICKNCAFYRGYTKDEQKSLLESDERDWDGECFAEPSTLNFPTIHPDPYGKACSKFKLSMKALACGGKFCQKVAMLVQLIEYARVVEKDFKFIRLKTKSEITYGKGGNNG